MVGQRSVRRLKWWRTAAVLMSWLVCSLTCMEIVSPHTHPYLCSPVSDINPIHFTHIYISNTTNTPLFFVVSNFITTSYTYMKHITLYNITAYYQKRRYASLQDPLHGASDGGNSLWRRRLLPSWRLRIYRQNNRSQYSGVCDISHKYLCIFYSFYVYMFVCCMLAFRYIYTQSLCVSFSPPCIYLVSAFDTRVSLSLSHNKKWTHTNI
jgi:hypothetical protein